MKKLIALLCAVCAAAMSLCVACASPLTGDTSNMGLWITLVVVAVIAVVVLLIVGKKKKNKQRADRPGPMARGGFYAAGPGHRPKSGCLRRITRRR